MLTADRNSCLSSTGRVGTLLALVFVASCSVADFAYDLAPRIALRYVDDYLQLDNRQEEQALSLFRERHALHARDELPRYYRFLGETRQAISDGITAGEVDTLFDDVTALAELGIERTIPAAASILAGLDADQLDALEERLEESAEEYREELDDDHKGRRLGETLKDIEEWIGEISDVQRAMLTRELQAMTETAPMWLEWRIERNERLISLLRDEPAQPVIEEFLAEYWLRRQEVSPALETATAENRARYRAMIVALDVSLSTAQRDHALARLAEYSQMVVDMMPDDVSAAVREGRMEQ